MYTKKIDEVTIRKVDEVKSDSASAFTQATLCNPDELKVVGKIYRMYFQGRQIYPEPEPEPVIIPKKKNKHFIIIPIKAKNSAIEFVKIPMYKAEKKLKAKPMGSVNISKLTAGGTDLTMEKMPLWVGNKEDFLMEEIEKASVEYMYKRSGKIKDDTSGGSQDAGCVKHLKCKRKSKGSVSKDKKKTKRKKDED